MKLTTAALLLLCLPAVSPAQSTDTPIKVETLTQNAAAWDGTPYKTYPSGHPQLSVVRITIPAHSVMKWHTHPQPNAAYVLSGELTVEKKDGTKRHFVAGQAIEETVNTVHRGVTGAEPAVLIVFYAGATGMSLSKPAQ